MLFLVSLHLGESAAHVSVLVLFCFDSSIYFWRRSGSEEWDFMLSKL